MASPGDALRSPGDRHVCHRVWSLFGLLLGFPSGLVLGIIRTSRSIGFSGRDRVEEGGIEWGVATTESELMG
jgi:hypothetical protein